MASWGVSLRLAWSRCGCRIACEEQSKWSKWFDGQITDGKKVARWVSSDLKLLSMARLVISFKSSSQTNHCELAVAMSISGRMQYHSCGR